MSKELEFEDAVVVTDTEDTAEETAEETATVTAVIKIDPTAPVVFKLQDKEVNLKVVKERIAEYELLTIDGHLDKAGYLKVKSAISDLLKTRTTLAKSVKQTIIDPINSYIAKVKDDLDEVSTELKRGQDLMQAKKDEIDNQIEIEKARVAKEQADKVQGRANNLFNLGATFDPVQGIYSFSYDTNLLLNSMMLNEYSDAEYAAFLTEVEESFANEQVRKDNEDKEAEAEKQRILDLDAQNHATTKKLNELEQALLAKQVKMRTKELDLLKAEFNGEDAFTVNGHIISADALAHLEEEDWEELMEKVQVANKPTHTFVSSAPINRVNTFESISVEEPPVDLFADVIENEVTEVYISDVNKEHSDMMHTLVPEPDTFEEVFNGDEGVICSTLVFNVEQPFFDFQVLKLIIRLFPEENEGLANEGIEPKLILDCGDVSNTDLKFIAIKAV